MEVNKFMLGFNIGVLLMLGIALYVINHLTFGNLLGVVDLIYLPVEDPPSY